MHPRNPPSPYIPSRMNLRHIPAGPMLQVLLATFFAWTIPCITSLWTLAPVAAQDTNAPSPSITPPTDLESCKLAIKQAEELFKEKKFGQSSDWIEACNSVFADLVTQADKKDLAEWERLHRKLAKAIDVLSIEGAEFSPLPEWSAIQAKVREMGKDKSKPIAPSNNNPATSNGVSFTKQVAPILVEHCGRCHVDKESGGFGMPTYEQLIKGSKGGVVLFPGDSASSPLVTSIEGGVMPPNGNKVSAEKLTILKNWIQQGAKYDGEDPKANLKTLATGEAPKPAEPSKPVEVMERTGKETISFANDIAPILVANCNGCHYGGNRPSGGLNFTNFAGLLRGGMSGAALTPKDGKGSLLVMKLLGEAGQRMPAGGRPALKPEEIEKITKWIDEGATFDGENRDGQLESVIMKSWANKASHTELMEKRMDRARSRWKVMSPNAPAEEANSDEVHVLGNVGKSTIERTLQSAESAIKTVRKQLKLSPKEPLVKGGVTIYALKSRYNYSELGKMIEGRSLPQEWTSHWRKDVVDVYVAIIPESSNPKLDETALVQQLTSLWMASHDGVPRWFAEGSGRAALAATAGQNDQRVKPWLAQLPKVVGDLKDVKPLTEGKMNEEEEGIVGFALVRTMQSSSMRKQYDALMRAIQAGTPFDQACQKSIGPVDQFLSQALGKKK